MRTLRAMRNLGVSGLLLVSLLCTVPVMAAEKEVAQETAPNIIVHMQSDVMYDAGYLLDAFGTFVDELKVEFADDPEAVAGINETYGFIQALGLDYLTTIRQQMTLDESAFNEIVTITMDPDGKSTPMGKWLNLNGTHSTFGHELGEDEFLMATTLARPGEYLALAAEGKASQDELMSKFGTPPAAIAGAMGIAEEYGPAVQAMLEGSDAIHIVIWGIDVAAMDIQAAVIVEYDKTAQPFATFMDSYTEKRKLTWRQEMQKGKPYQVLTNEKVPIPLTFVVDSNIAVLATSQEVAAMSLDSALISTRIMLPEYIYFTRLNIERLRQLVPPWAADLAMAQAGAEGAGVPDVSQIMEMPMGEVSVLRSGTPDAFTVTLSADRELVRVFGKTYELMMQAAVRDMIKTEQKTRRQNAVQQGADAFKTAIDLYFGEHQVYPTSIAQLIEDGSLELMPLNPFTKEPMLSVTFEERSQGNFTYVPITIGRQVVGYQLLVYGATADYEDRVDNYNFNEDGSFIEASDGYEDMVQIFMSSTHDDMDDEWESDLPIEESSDWEVGEPVEGQDGAIT